MKKFKIASEIANDAYFIVNISDFEFDVEQSFYINDGLGAERFLLHINY